MSVTTTDLWRMSATDLAHAIRSRQTSSQEVIESLATDRGHKPRSTPSRSFWASRLSKPRRQPTGRSQVAVICRRSTASLSLSKRTSTWSVRQPLWVSMPWRARIRVWTLLLSTGCGLLGRSRSAEPTVPTSPFAGTPTANFGETTVNPWDRSRTPGASSGGEAAALATGMTPLGLGSDGLGSLRWPAQCCGISVLKPTLGRIPHASTLEPVDAPIGVQLTAVEGRWRGSGRPAGRLRGAGGPS